MNHCDFTAWEAAHQARLHAALEAALPAADTHPARLHAAMRYACEGGKRLRALMVYAAGEALGVATEMLDAPAVAVELIHTFSLVHDDLPAMDDDDLRRGRATLHKAFDEATAILTGDALQTLAFETLVAGGLPVADAVRLHWLSALAAGTGSRGMTGGQAVDLESEHRHLSIAELESLHRLKTGALMTASLRMGLAAGSASAAQQQAIERYASAVGLAYQIQDDVLDVEGTAESLGKTPGKDALAEKSTHVSLLGLEPSRQRAQRLFDHAAQALHEFGDEATALRELLNKIRRRHS